MQGGAQDKVKVKEMKEAIGEGSGGETAGLWAATGCARTAADYQHGGTLR